MGSSQSLEQPGGLLGGAGPHLAGVHPGRLAVLEHDLAEVRAHAAEQAQRLFARL